MYWRFVDSHRSRLFLMTMGDSRTPRLDSLTSLRFFAAFGVVVYHCALYMPQVLWPFHAIVQYGHVGVTFFFVLSGFVLTWSRRHGDTKQNFYVRRFARVWPSHFVTTLLAIPVMLIVHEPVLWAALPAVLLMVHAWIPPGSWHYAFNGPSWSLSAEAFFYALFPLLIVVAAWGVGRLRMLAAVTTAFLVGGAVLVPLVLPEMTWGFLLGVNPAYRVGEFVLGIVLALLVERRAIPHISFRWALFMLAVSYIGLAGAAWTLNWGTLPAFVPAIVMLPGFILLIAAAAQRNIVGQSNRMLSHRVMIKLGEVSFALYLVHALVIHAAIALIEPLGFAAWEWTLMVYPLLVASVALAWALHVYVEVPAESFIRRKFVRPQATASPEQPAERAPRPAAELR